MDKFLVFCLCASLGSFGGYSGHERRNSGNMPYRSAILGLIGAALGIERSDHEGQISLLKYGIASKLLAENSFLRDFHTVQSINSTIKRPNSRKSAFLAASGKNIKTIITKRDYRTDIAVAISVWNQGGNWSLEDIAEALKFPKFLLYVGRKSCPLSAPLNPQIVSAINPIDSLSTVYRTDTFNEENNTLGSIVSDPFPEGKPDLTEFIPSEPIDRVRWHFEQKEQWRFFEGADK